MKFIFTLFFAMVVSVAMQATTFNVAATNDMFTPANITVQVGDVVNWTFSGSQHDVTSGSNCTPDGKFSSGTENPGGTYSFTFTSAGSFPYYCSFHCSVGMVGNITVASTSGIQIVNASVFIASCYPNPFIGSTTLSYGLNHNAMVNIMVVDMTGKKIIDIQQNNGAGTYLQQLSLDRYPSGTYIVKLSLDGIPSKEMELVKE